MIGQAERISQLSLYFTENMNYPEIPIIGITSGKGGTGKSMFILNLAKALFENNLRVLVIDMDLNFSNLHILLNIFPDSSIKDYFQNNTSLEKIVQKEEFADIIFGESGSRNKITETALDLFFRNLSKIEFKPNSVFCEK